MKLIAENDYFSESEMRLMVGVTASLLLHLAVLTALNPPLPTSRFGTGVLQAALRGTSSGAVNERNGSGSAQQSSATSTSFVSQSPKAPQAVDRPRQEAAAPAPAGEGNASRNDGYYGRVFVQASFDASGITGMPALNNAEFVPFNNLAPKAALPPGFEVTYPEVARAAAKKATVKLAVFLDETGRVVEVLVLEEDPPGNLFADAAVGTLRGTRFRPGSVAGQPVKSKLMLRVQFGFE